MTTTAEAAYRPGEFHAFEGGGRRFVYLPAGAIFEIDGAVEEALATLSGGPVTRA